MTIGRIDDEKGPDQEKSDESTAKEPRHISTDEAAETIASLLSNKKGQDTVRLPEWNPETCKMIDATLAELERKGVIRTEMIPADPAYANRHIYLIQQIHFRNSEGNAEWDHVPALYQSMQSIYALQKKNMALLMEGSPQGKDIKRREGIPLNIDVRGRSTVIFDPKAQEKLFESTEGIAVFQKTLQKIKMNGISEGILNVTDFMPEKGLLGIETPDYLKEMETMVRDFQENAKRYEALGLPRSKFIVSIKDKKTLITIESKGVTMDFAQFIQELDILVRFWKRLDILSAKREEGAAAYAAQRAAEGKIPIVVYGLAHGDSLIQKLRGKNTIHSIHPASISADFKTLITGKEQKAREGVQTLLMKLQEYAAQKKEVAEG